MSLVLLGGVACQMGPPAAGEERASGVEATASVPQSVASPSPGPNFAATLAARLTAMALAPTQAPVPTTAHPAGPPTSEATALPRERSRDEAPEASVWIGAALDRLREYDTRYGTVMIPALQQTSIVPARLDGAWASFIPVLRTVTLEPELAFEESDAVATVLAHEASHAVDHYLHGNVPTEAACYAYEISAFSLQARVWAHFHGSSGKREPASDLEEELNLILRLARTQPERLLSQIQRGYRDQCT